MSKPTVGQVVHYTSYGTPGGEYPSVCRAAIITAVDEYQPPIHGQQFVGHVSLAVLNPEGMFFNKSVHQDEGAETPGDPECPLAASHGTPLRYCQCGWIEAKPRGGTWHWPERED